MTTQALPKLITFDGEARSGKGTIVSGVKDYLRDECGYKVMLIDAGQVFRVLVVAASRSGVDLDDPAALDAFLRDETEAEKCVRLVKDVYHMSKDERDALLYTNEVGANSAKVGARPLSQEFKDDILRKWYHDAHNESYDVILHDGRALEETGAMLERESLCDFVMGLYFTCDGIVGARRTLGFATRQYSDLSSDDKASVDELVEQIKERNRKDAERAVQPVVPPLDAAVFALPQAPRELTSQRRPMFVFDTSAEMTKSEMIMPVARLAAQALKRSR